jgi:hypothetical protein
LTEKEKFLLVKGCAGIGNRLFTLAAAIGYARATGRTLLVDWRDGVFSEPGKNAFDLFFELNDVNYSGLDALSRPFSSIYPDSMSDSLNDNLYDNFAAGYSVQLRKLKSISRLRGRLSRLDSFWYYRKKNNFQKPVHSDGKATMALFSSKHLEYGHKLSRNLDHQLVIFADYWPDEPAADFSHIMFKAVVTEKAQKLAVELGVKENTIGIHIRCSDNKPGRELETLKACLEKEASSGKKIFLATDSREIEADFKSLLQSSMVVMQKFYPEKSTDENMHHWSKRSGDYTYAERIFEESLLDLLLLSSCPQIWFQGNSSYSKICLIFNKGRSQCADWLRLNDV